MMHACSTVTTVTVFNMFHTCALNYNIQQTDECALVKCTLLHIDNHQHVLVVFATIIWVSQRILIKHTMNT